MTPKQLTPKQRLAAIVAKLSVTHETNCDFVWLAEYASSLETQLENRRAVEGWSMVKENDCARSALTYRGRMVPCIVGLSKERVYGGESLLVFDGKTPDEAFARAAGWVREQ